MRIESVPGRPLGIPDSPRPENPLAFPVHLRKRGHPATGGISPHLADEFEAGGCAEGKATEFDASKAAIGVTGIGLDANAGAGGSRIKPAWAPIGFADLGPAHAVRIL